MRWLLKALGLVEDEYHHIVSGFTGMRDELVALVERKARAVADQKDIMDVAALAKARAESAIADAKGTLAFIEKIVPQGAAK